MSCSARCPLIPLCLLLSLTLTAGANDLREFFPLYLAGQPGWTAAVRADATGRDQRAADVNLYPELSLTLKGAGYDDVRGIRETFPAPELSLWSVPLDAGLAVSVPLWDPTRAGVVSIGDLESGRSRTELGEYRASLLADYLVSVAAYASAEGLARIRGATMETYRDLASAADRRFRLGAGSRKDVLRGQVAFQQAETSFAQARHQADAVRQSWPAALQAPLGPEAGLDAPDWWVPLAARWGVDLGFLFTGAPVPAQDLPDARPLGSVALARQKAVREAEVLSAFPLPSVAWYGQVDLNATPDQTGEVSWEAITQTGIKISWTPLGRTTAGAVVQAGQRASGDKQAALTEAEGTRKRTLAALAADYQAKVASWAQRAVTRATAGTFVESLRIELAGGTSTLDTYLQGSQLAVKATEDEWTSRWEVVAAALLYLKTAGLTDPEDLP